MKTAIGASDGDDLMRHLLAAAVGFGVQRSARGLTGVLLGAMAAWLIEQNL